MLRKDAMSASQAVDARTSQTVRDEMGKLRDKMIEPLRQQLARDLAEQLKVVDASMKDHLGKFFKSKTTLDSIGQSVTQAVQPTVVNTYRETFQKIIVPNFEKSCQMMYQQVNASFIKGTQVYKRLFAENTEMTSFSVIIIVLLGLFN